MLTIHFYEATTSNKYNMNTRLALDISRAYATMFSFSKNVALVLFINKAKIFTNLISKVFSKSTCYKYQHNGSKQVHNNNTNSKEE